MDHHLTSVDMAMDAIALELLSLVILQSAWLEIMEVLSSKAGKLGCWVRAVEGQEAARRRMCVGAGGPAMASLAAGWATPPSSSAVRDARMRIRFSVAPSIWGRRV